MIYLVIILFIFFLSYFYINEYYYDINYNNYLNYDDKYYQNNITINNISKHLITDKCLDVKDNKLILNKCNNTDGQKWEYDNYRFTNKKINKCIDKNFNIIDCDKIVDKFIKINYNNGFFYKLYSPENCINVDKNNNFSINQCDPINNQNQIFTNINDQSFNNYDDELKIKLYYEILKNYKIFQKDSKYSNEFKLNFNIHTFNLYYDYYIKYGDNYTDDNLDNLYNNIKTIITNINNMKEEIIGQSYEYNLTQLKDYKLFDVKQNTSSIFSSCINKYNIFSFIQFKNKYGDGYKNEDLHTLYELLTNDKKTDQECLDNFKKLLELKDYKLLKNIQNIDINKFNINLFIDFKNKYKDYYKKDDLLSLYKILLDDKNTDKKKLIEFKEYIDKLK